MLRPLYPLTDGGAIDLDTITLILPKKGGKANNTVYDDRVLIECKKGNFILLSFPTINEARIFAISLNQAVTDSRTTKVAPETISLVENSGAWNGDRVLHTVDGRVCSVHECLQNGNIVVMFEDGTKGVFKSGLVSNVSDVKSA